MGGLVRLTPAARIVVRPGPALQFGIDARTCGIIDDFAPEATGGLVTAFQRARSPLPRDTLTSNLVRAGLGEAAAASLLADLTAYGVIVAVPDSPPHVAILGRNTLASATAELLEAAGCVTRRPLRGETDKRFLWHLEPDVPLVVADRWAHGRTLAPLVRKRGDAPCLPIALVDGTCVIGPLDIAGRGPCPMCLDLYRIGKDPQWNAITAQIPAASTPNALLVALGSALAASVILSLVGLGHPAPGSRPKQYPPGWQLTHAPFGDATEEIIQPHPRCPLCFAAQQV